MEGLAAVGKFKANISRMVSPVLGVLAFIGAVTLLFMQQWVPAIGLLVMSFIMYVWFKWSGVVQKSPTLQKVSGAATALDIVQDFFD